MCFVSVSVAPRESQRRLHALPVRSHGIVQYIYAKATASLYTRNEGGTYQSCLDNELLLAPCQRGDKAMHVPEPSPLPRYKFIDGAGDANHAAELHKANNQGYQVVSVIYAPVDALKPILVLMQRHT